MYKRRNNIQVIFLNNRYLEYLMSRIILLPHCTPIPYSETTASKICFNFLKFHKNARSILLLMASG